MAGRGRPKKFNSGPGLSKSASLAAPKPAESKMGELPKDIIGGHMGAMIKPPKPLGGPAIKSPPKPPKLAAKAPPKMKV